MNLTLHTQPTTAGPLHLLAEDGTVLAAGFTDPRVLARRLGSDPPPHPATTADPIGAALAAWADGDMDALVDLPARQSGTDFQQEVWAALRKIPAGQTRSYGEVAAAVRRPAAARAVGTACGRNLLAPLVPCHRVVAGDGGAGGYAYGLSVKDWLLRHESGQGVGHG